MIDGQTHAHTHTHAGNDNTRRPKLASGKNNMDIWQLGYGVRITQISDILPQWLLDKWLSLDILWLYWFHWTSSFACLKMNFGLILLILNMATHRSCTNPTHVLSINIRRWASFLVSAESYPLSKYSLRKKTTEKMIPRPTPPAVKMRRKEIMFKTV